MNTTQAKPSAATEAPVLEKLDFMLCVRHKKNPNSNGAGELYSLGTVDQIRARGVEGFARMKKAFSLRTA